VALGDGLAENSIGLFKRSGMGPHPRPSAGSYASHFFRWGATLRVTRSGAIGDPGFDFDA
jgi:hypothetical protein